MQVYDFSTTANTKTYFYDSANDKFCSDEKAYGSTIYLMGEAFQIKGKADKKIIVDSNLTAQDIDKIFNKVL